MRSGLFESSAVSSNQSGEITQDQREAIKSRYSTVSGWITLLIMGVVFAGVFAVAGKFLADSTALAIGAVIGIILVSFIITSWLGNIVALGRMGNLSVEQTSGEVVWKGNQYIAESGGRRLEPIRGSMHNLQPGDYTFYVLRGTNWILSAQAVGAPQTSAQPAARDFDSLKALIEKPIDFDPAQSPEKAAQRMAELHNAVAQFQGLDPSRLSTADVDRIKGLGQAMAAQMRTLTGGIGGLHNMGAMVQAFHQATLDPLDSHGRAELERALRESGATDAPALDDNRQGRMTSRQRGRLLRVAGNYVVFGLLATAFAIFAMVSAYQKVNWGWGVAALVGLVVSAALFYQARVDLGDWSGGRVEMVESMVGKRTHSTSSGRSNTTHYYYMAHNMSFEVSHAAYEALLEDRTYKLYYASGTKKFLNIEPA